VNTIESLARELHGPILVLGASGFVGANLMRAVLEVRSDVFGTASQDPAWRLASIGAERLITVDLLARGNVATLLERVQPGTIFDCVAYGAYSFEQDVERMYQTNVVFKQELIEQLLRRGTHSTSTPAVHRNTALARRRRMRGWRRRRTVITR